PELTGRENIYLSGAILGMSKREMDGKFDKIVDFSGIEKFIDTPAKRYSSGMWVRLGFAVAAHLEPEILLVDEVLAVGDAQFQKKCLGKMDNVAREGRTVLFVSHNMAAIKALVNRCLLIDQGKLELDGDVHSVVERYLMSSTKNEKNIRFADRKRESHCSLRAKIVGITVIADGKENPEQIDSKKPFTVRLTIYSSSESNIRCSAKITICDDFQPLIWLDSGALQNKQYIIEKGITQIECLISPTNLYSG
ncbi:unnamed protein product, partial [marine sediment metagenome]